jgi:hypothetical protein
MGEWVCEPPITLCIWQYKGRWGRRAPGPGLFRLSSHPKQFWIVLMTPHVGYEPVKSPCSPLLTLLGVGDGLPPDK